MHTFLQSSKYSVFKAQKLGSIEMRAYASTQSTFALFRLLQIFPVAQMLSLSAIYKQMLVFTTVLC